MAHYHFLKFIAGLSIVLVLGHVYQHNRVIKLSYEKQRIEQLKQRLSKRKNELLVELAHAKNHQEVKQWARNEKAMDMTPLSHIITFTTQGSFDCFLTTTPAHK